jgi:nicotinamide mononucleotide (NMN) deamidase PncC
MMTEVLSGGIALTTEIGMSVTGCLVIAGIDIETPIGTHMIGTARGKGTDSPINCSFAPDGLYDDECWDVTHAITTDLYLRMV